MVERQAEAAKPMGNGVLPAAAAAKGVWAKWAIESDQVTKWAIESDQVKASINAKTLQPGLES